MIKEPNGSHAARFVMSLLPATRLIFLYRDGRDVRPGLWQHHLSADESALADEIMGEKLSQLGYDGLPAR